jgi:hypothetical protein
MYTEGSRDVIVSCDALVYLTRRQALSLASLLLNPRYSQTALLSAPNKHRHTRGTRGQQGAREGKHYWCQAEKGHGCGMGELSIARCTSNYRVFPSHVRPSESARIPAWSTNCDVHLQHEYTHNWGQCRPCCIPFFWENETFRLLCLAVPCLTRQRAHRWRGMFQGWGHGSAPFAPALWSRRTSHRRTGGVCRESDQRMTVFWFWRKRW